MKKKIFEIIASVALISGSALMMFSCSKEENDSFGNGGTAISIDVDFGTAAMSVKGASGDGTSLQTGRMFLSDADGEIVIPMDYEETDGIGTAVSRISTKGALVNTSLDDYEHLSEFTALVDTFQVYAYYNSGEAFMTKQKVKWSESAGKWTYSPLAFWPSRTVLNFFSYTNLPESGTSVSVTSEGQTLTHVVPADTDDQTDILLGYYSGSGSRTGTAEIRFEHPLTAVVFKTGEMPGVSGIKSIALKGVYQSGTTTQYGAGSSFTWEASGSIDVSHTFETPVALPVSGENVQIGDAFLIIPQNVEKKNVVLEVTLVMESGSEKTLSTTFIFGNWKSGKTNTYTLNAYEKSLEVELLRAKDEQTLKNVRVRNAGGIAAYTRVAVVANWKDSKGDIVRHCNWIETGTVSEPNWGDGKNWKLHSDGWFYYQNGIAQGKSTENLFASFTSGTAPIDGLVLDMEILVQGVEYDSEAAKAKGAWGTDVPLTTDLED